MAELSIKLLLPHGFESYTLEKPPSQYNYGSGVGVKYARCEKACEVYCKVSRVTDIESIEPNDIVLADWLWFSSSPDNDIVKESKKFVELNNTKIIYGSELSVLCWSHSVLNQVIDAADIITHNTLYQKKIYEVMGIYNSRFLSDPVPVDIFKPSQVKSRQLVCIGQVGLHKNSDAVLGIFEHLKDTDVQCVYIGSNMTWGAGFTDKDSARIYDNLKEIAYEYVDAATQRDVASILNSSSFYVHTAFHDVASSSYQESMCSGNVSFGLGHPIVRERTPYYFKNAKEIADAIIEYPFNSEHHAKEISEVVKTSHGKWSYPAWREQLTFILKLIGVL